jgi:hypothetical protein
MLRPPATSGHILASISIEWLHFRKHVEANMTRLSDLRSVWRGISAGGLLYHAYGLIDLSAVAPRFRRQRRDRVMNGRDSQPAVEGLCSPIARSDRNRPSQVLPQTLEEGMADLSLGRFGSVLDLGVNVIWLQSVPKISIERFAELLEDCLQVIGVFPSGLSSLVGARRPVCPFVLGWRLLLFHGQFCQNPTQREWAIPVGDPSGEAYSVPSAITLSISLASFLKWTARRS